MGEITISASRSGEDTLICVADNGIGMKEEDLEHLRHLADGTEKVSADNTGFGIANVAQRLRLNFGPDYGLDIESEYGEGTRITVHTPGQFGTEAAESRMRPAAPVYTTA